VLLVADLPQREAVSPEMAAAPVLRVEALGVEPVHPVQGAGECVPSAFDDEVVVVGHQAERISVQPEAVDCSPELGEELPAVVAVEEDLPPLDPARRRMPDAVLRKRRSRHASHSDQR
jgi:hypothetical protein